MLENIMDNRIKLIILGDLSVGKSCLIKRKCDHSFVSQYSSTIGIDFFTMPYTISGKEYKINIWDTGGQEAFRTIIKSYFKGVDGVILAFDITNYRSFANLDYWQKSLQEYDINPVGVLVGCKSDLEKQRAVRREVAESYADKLIYPYWECSAVTGENIDTLFYHFIPECIEKKLNIKCEQFQIDKQDHSKSKPICCAIS